MSRVLQQAALVIIVIIFGCGSEKSGGSSGNGGGATGRSHGSSGSNARQSLSTPGAHPIRRRDPNPLENTSFPSGEGKKVVADFLKEFFLQDEDLNRAIQMKLPPVCKIVLCTEAANDGYGDVAALDKITETTKGAVGGKCQVSTVLKTNKSEIDAAHKYMKIIGDQDKHDVEENDDFKNAQLVVIAPFFWELKKGGQILSKRRLPDNFFYIVEYNSIDDDGRPAPKNNFWGGINKDMGIWFFPHLALGLSSGTVADQRSQKFKAIEKILKGRTFNFGYKLTNFDTFAVLSFFANKKKTVMILDVKNGDKKTASSFAEIETFEISESGVTKALPVVKNERPKFPLKIVRIKLDGLSSEDFQFFSSRSNLITGCTGDLSFSEVMSRPFLVPFYSAPSHKWEVFEEFQKTLDEYFVKFPQIEKAKKILKIFTNPQQKNFEDLDENSVETLREVWPKFYVFFWRKNNGNLKYKKFLENFFANRNQG